VGGSSGFGFPAGESVGGAGGNVGAGVDAELEGSDAGEEVSSVGNAGEGIFTLIVWLTDALVAVLSTFCRMGTKGRKLRVLGMAGSARAEPNVRTTTPATAVFLKRCIHILSY